MIVSEKQKEVLPKVCVIIPAYNRAEFIRETIDSVLKQTYKNIELIVVDDGSTDCTMEILQEYKDRLVVLQHLGGVNKGQSAAINLGIQSSESKYVAILDSDDLFYPEKIALQVKHLEKNPGTGVVYTNGKAFGEKEELLFYIYEDNHCAPNGPEAVLLSSWFNVPSNSLVRRDVFEQVGPFDESMRSAQDHDMAVRLAEVTKIEYLPDVLWAYRRHPTSQSGMHAARRWRIGFKILKKAQQRYPYTSIVIRKRKAVLHFRLGQCLLEERRYGSALWHFLVAGISDPKRSLHIITGRENVSSPHC